MTTWEELTELEKLACEFSDRYKEAHGVRPRFDVSGWTEADFATQFESLGRICQENEAVRARFESEAAAEFEKIVSGLLARGAVDRSTAVRWLMDAEGVGGDVRYFEYAMGLPYHYLAEKVG